MAKPKERTLKRPEEALHLERFQIGIGGDFASESAVFTITKLLPPLGAELQYRIKSAGEVHEPVASEHELQVAELEKPIVAAGWRLSSVDVDAARIFAELS